MKYDTSEIRQAARQVGSVAEDVDSAATRDVAKMLSSLSGTFEGEAATALRDELTDLKSDLLALTKGLKGIQSELMAYAARIEEADRGARDYINRNG